MAISWIAEEVQTLAVACDSCVSRDAWKNCIFLSFNIANSLTFEEIRIFRPVLPGKFTLTRKQIPQNNQKLL